MDCDDNNNEVQLDAEELCNGRDDDSDGDSDGESAADAPEWFADSDSDGFGETASSTSICEAPPGYVSDGTDCDDNDNDIILLIYISGGLQRRHQNAVL